MHECVATIDALRKRERVTDEDNGRGGVSTHHFPVLFPFNIGERGGGDGCRSRTKNHERGTGPVGYVAKDSYRSYRARESTHTRIPTLRNSFFILHFFLQNDF